MAVSLTITVVIDMISVIIEERARLEEHCIPALTDGCPVSCTQIHIAHISHRYMVEVNIWICDFGLLEIKQKVSRSFGA